MKKNRVSGFAVSTRCGGETVEKETRQLRRDAFAVIMMSVCLSRGEGCFLCWVAAGFVAAAAVALAAVIVVSSSGGCGGFGVQASAQVRSRSLGHDAAVVTAVGLSRGASLPASRKTHADKYRSDVSLLRPPTPAPRSSSRHFMRDMVHWRALDPLDIQPDEWLTDVGKYNLLCSLGHLQEPKDERQTKDLANALGGVDSRETCDTFLFQSHFDR